MSGPNKTPTPPTDIQAAKRELLRIGRSRGYLTEGEIRDSLPEDLITPVELETFFFTLEMMNIERRAGSAPEAQEH